MFRVETNNILEKHKEEKIAKAYQDHRAILVYLSMMYPDKHYLYKYTEFVEFAKLIDYAKLPKAGDVDLVFLFESMCDMILRRVMQDGELLNKYESRRQKYYDPEYHLLVQDIVYSIVYFDRPEILESKEDVPTKKFELKAKEVKVSLKGGHVDHIAKAKKTKAIGDAGEEFVFQYEKEEVLKYKLSKNKDVRWVSKLDGDGFGYDILSYDEHGNEKYIEVKTTAGAEKSGIYITANELKKSEEVPEQYYLYRVYDFDTSTYTGIISIRKGSLKDLCISTQSYRVEFE